MKKAILATKIGMTQIFNADGVLVPVTVLEAGPCVVTQIKTVENDGYSAVQVGFGDKKEKVVEKDANGKKSVAGWPSAFRQSLARISAFMPPATCPAPSGRPAARRSNTGSI